MTDNILQLKPQHPADFAKGFDPLHEKYILNDTIELSMTSEPDGLLGDNVPYSVGSDNTVTAMLIGCFLLAMLAISVSRTFMVRQIRNFFYVPRSVADMTETDYEVGFQFFLILQTSLTLGVFYYLFSQSYLSISYPGGSQLKAIIIFTAIFIAYFIVKKIVYSLVGWTFFTAKKNYQWSLAWLFLAAIEGVALFPIILLQVYLGIPLQTTVIYTAFVIILVKLLSFYKCYAIFFKHGGGFVQNILYFCALELIPLLALAGILLITGNYLMVNY